MILEKILKELLDNANRPTIFIRYGSHVIILVFSIKSYIKEKISDILDENIISVDLTAWKKILYESLIKRHTR